MKSHTILQVEQFVNQLEAFPDTEMREMILNKGFCKGVCMDERVLENYLKFMKAKTPEELASLTVKDLQEMLCHIGHMSQVLNPRQTLRLYEDSLKKTGKIKRLL